ncbi:MAG: UxaA family hydrolase, partial [Pseudomonadota bacterium]
MTAKVLHLHHDDNVVVALDPIDQGQYLPQYDVYTLNPIEAGHKVALGDMKSGDHVVKLGVVIGIAKADIQKGEHVHRHNLKMPEAAITHVGGGQRERDLPHDQFKGRTFKGYRREDGRVGTRNFIGILPVVNCSATVTRMIADHFRHF